MGGHGLAGGSHLSFKFPPSRVSPLSSGCRPLHTVSNSLHGTAAAAAIQRLCAFCGRLPPTPPGPALLYDLGPPCPCQRRRTSSAWRCALPACLSLSPQPQSSLVPHPFHSSLPPALPLLSTFPTSNSSRHTRTTHSRACDQPTVPPTTASRLRHAHGETEAPAPPYDYPCRTRTNYCADATRGAPAHTACPYSPSPARCQQRDRSTHLGRLAASTIPSWRRFYIRARHLVSQRTRRARFPPRSISLHPSLLRSLPAACSLGRNAAIRTSLLAFLPASCICDAIAPSPSSHLSSTLFTHAALACPLRAPLLGTSDP